MRKKPWNRALPKPQPLKPTSIKFGVDHRKFLEMTAAAQGHYNVSEVIKRLLDREMGVTK